MTLHIAHLHHGLRGSEADHDAEFVEGIARLWQLSSTIERADVLTYKRTHRLSLEDAARRLRYEFLQRVATAEGARAIAVAHTADDQVETVIMHWLRGAGAAGLRGMLPVQNWPGGVPLVRPLLTVRRREIEEYCTAHGLTPRRDRSNEDQHIWRNRLRVKVLPILEQAHPGLYPSVLRAAHILGDEDTFLGALARDTAARIIKVDGDHLVIDLAGWQALHVALQRRVLRQAWKQLTAGADDLSWTHTEAACRVLAGRVGARLHLPHGVVLYRGYTNAVLTRGQGVESLKPDLPMLTVDTLPIIMPGTTILPDSTWQVEAVVTEWDGRPIGKPEQPPLTEYFDLAVVGRNFHLRRWQPGDRMPVLGLDGTKKVHDIMVDAKLPRDWRRCIPLLATPDHLLWIVGTRRSEWGKIVPSTQQVVRVAFRRLD